MTVQELIDKLKGFPPNANVRAPVDDGSEDVWYNKVEDPFWSETRKSDDGVPVVVIRGKG